MSSNAGTSVNDYRILFFFALASFLAVIVVLLFYFLKITVEVERVRIYKEDFLSAVETSVSNFLSNISFPGEQEEKKMDPFKQPQFKSVPGMGFYTDVRGRNFCLIDGCSFAPGDFCPFGLILDVTSSRVYVDGISNIIILATSNVKPLTSSTLNNNANYDDL